jgi:hypothetical protein
MYKEVQVEASLTRRVESYFRCSRCGAEADAVAVGTGVGEGISPYGVDQDAATQRATKTAERNALDDAHTALAVVPCPQCGERDPVAVAKYKRKTVRWVAWAVGLFVVGGGLLSMAMDFGRTPAVLGGVLGVIGAAIVYKGRVQMFDGATDQVQFRLRSPYRQKAPSEPENPAS